MLLLLSFFPPDYLQLTYTLTAALLLLLLLFFFFLVCLPWHKNLVNIHTISLSSCIHSFQWARKRDENASSSSHGPDSSPSPDWHNFPLSTFHARSTWIFHMPSADKLTHTHTHSTLRQLWTNFPPNFFETIHQYTRSLCVDGGRCAFSATSIIIKFCAERFSHNQFSHTHEAPRLFRLGTIFLEFIKHTFTATHWATITFNIQRQLQQQQQQ